MNRLLALLFAAAAAVAAACTVLYVYWPGPPAPAPVQLEFDLPQARQLTEAIQALARAQGGQLDALIADRLAPTAGENDRLAIRQLAARLHASADWSVEAVTQQGGAAVVVLRIDRDGATTWPSIVFAQAHNGPRWRAVQW